MSFKIIPTGHFKDQVRSLMRKYPRIRQDLRELDRILRENPYAGVSLGQHAHKLRLGSADMARGKRGGYRVITYVNDGAGKIRLLTIYAKPRKADISDAEIKYILEKEGML
ncbi:hypothetical protein DENIS_5133 [Desulfonema ishimotonii]|uniref:Addiction module toxin RelE n=1 Tax=Desulfonema ishimotonii TaxID=45657 RepID=A0A401G4H0_9BACT|nr:addiction module toxin RelE [Desulfonema ishimotonii]GBC64116.1 hypothetical protein DENIS_5133 [Desulfonema ishimotonii]